MSFTEIKRKAIQRYMLEKIRCDDSDFLKKTADSFAISETSVRRYIKECLERKILTEAPERRTGYKLIAEKKEWVLENTGKLEEDTIFWKCVNPSLKDLPVNVHDIWYYTFTEIMNNAIEHSQGKQIRFSLQRDALYVEISIADNGIGIFHSLQNYLCEKKGLIMDKEQAAMELYKGKLTTNPDSHSGEGIFFVSKMLSEFALWSENTIYSYRCNDRDRFI